MMRCDVCHTKIPPGSTTCPNCGYRVKKETTATYVQNQNTTSTSKRPQKSIPYKRIVKVILIVVVAFFLIKMLISIGSFIMAAHEETYVENITPEEDSPLQEYIDDGKDDGTAETALQYRDEIINLFDDLDMEMIDQYENVYDYGQGVNASFNISAQKNNIEYTLRASFVQSSLTDQAVSLSWESEESIREQKPDLDVETIEVLSHQIQRDMLDILDQYRTKLQQEDQSSYKINQYLDDYSVYLSESYYLHIYHYYYSVNAKM